MQIGERLREERERLGFTQSDFSKAGGVAFRTYCDYEAGKSEPKASTLSLLGGVGVDVLYVVTGQRTPLVSINNEEQKLVENYRAMDDAARLNMQAVSDSFAKSSQDVKKNAG
ncbi:helix-turn-helix domain-containing protein [Enterobacter ludwigii]|uniref:helix-turn-helix domain-containing protein n=1 Tax=Enterobacter ludwigii TaxID=299767 RepID=UPI003BEF2E0A